MAHIDCIFIGIGRFEFFNLALGVLLLNIHFIFPFIVILVEIFGILYKTVHQVIIGVMQKWDAVDAFLVIDEFSGQGVVVEYLRAFSHHKFIDAGLVFLIGVVCWLSQ